MEMELITTIIGNLGFPIFVSIWLLFKMNTQEKRTQELLYELKIAIEKLCIINETRKDNGIAA